MKIIAQRTSPVTGKDNHMVIFATNQQLIAWHDGMLIQDAMPDATVDQRVRHRAGIQCLNRRMQHED